MNFVWHVCGYVHLFGRFGPRSFVFIIISLVFIIERVWGKVSEGERSAQVFFLSLSSCALAHILSSSLHFPVLFFVCLVYCCRFVCLFFYSLTLVCSSFLACFLCATRTNHPRCTRFLSLLLSSPLFSYSVCPKSSLLFVFEHVAEDGRANSDKKKKRGKIVKVEGDAVRSCTLLPRLITTSFSFVLFVCAGAFVTLCLFVFVDMSVRIVKLLFF
jgi:hypothetical protein